MNRLLIAVLVTIAACDSDPTEPAKEKLPDITALVDIDDRGRILVTFRDTVTGLAGILENGEYVLLPRPSGGMVITSVDDMNESGRVLGSVRRLNGQHVPFTWDPGMRELQVISPGDNNNYLPRALNDAGTYVGTVLLKGTDDLNPERLPFIGDQAGIRHLHPPIANGTWRWAGAVDINNVGQVVGWWDDTDDGGLYISGFSWMAGTGFTRVEGESGPRRGETLPTAVNENGDVVGLNTDSSSVGFLWNRLDGMRSIGRYTCGHDINDAGEVVGRTNREDGSGSVPFHWSASTGVTRIPTSGLLGLATRINNRGQVIGQSEEYFANGMRVTHFTWSRAAGLQILGEIEYRWESQAAARAQVSMSLSC